MSEKILFLTGKLAERQLRRILSSMKPEFSYKISQIGVNVAALMSENIIMRRLEKEQKADRIIVPGKFRGNLKKLSRYFNQPRDRVAKKLGVCQTYLKKICRRKGIEKWPYRKIKAIENFLNSSSVSPNIFHVTPYLYLYCIYPFHMYYKGSPPFQHHDAKRWASVPY